MKETKIAKLEKEKDEVVKLARYLFLFSCFTLVAFLLIALIPSYEERQLKQENQELQKQIWEYKCDEFIKSDGYYFQDFQEGWEFYESYKEHCEILK